MTHRFAITTQNHKALGACGGVFLSCLPPAASTFKVHTKPQPQQRGTTAADPREPAAQGSLDSQHSPFHRG